MRRLNPSAIHPPFATYAHGVEVVAGARVVFCSGQFGTRRDAAFSLQDPFPLNPYVVSAQYWGGYMKVRDEFVSNPPPASTLMIVQGFARPEFKIEIEAVAARAP